MPFTHRRQPVPAVIPDGGKTDRQLGEYYTPSWLARVMVRELVDDPLNQRVLDPACGSVTFVAEAVTHFIAAAHEPTTSTALPFSPHHPGSDVGRITVILLTEPAFWSTAMRQERFGAPPSEPPRPSSARQGPKPPTRADVYILAVTTGPA